MDFVFVLKFLVRMHCRIISFSLVYPITVQGRWGTTDHFATNFCHLLLISAALVVLAKSLFDHSLIVFQFFCQPVLHFPFTFLVESSL